MRCLFEFLCVCALVGTLPLSASAQAETDSVLVSPGQLEVAQRSELQSRLADLEAAYQKANVRKPRAGVAVSVIAIAGGVAVLMTGLVLHQGILAQPSERDQRVGAGVMAAGSISIAAGAGGLAFSGFRLKRAKRERQSLKPEIERVRSALDSDAERR